MQFNLIKEILTGSITGYITNAIAIKMIFREYGIGKLKLGGVIVKTREEFINNISSLVEREIINPQTLSDELSKESFKNSIGNLTYDLLNTVIYKNASDLKLGNFDGFDSTIGKTEVYMKQCVEEQFPIVFDNICKGIYLKDIFNDKQVQSISEQIFDSVLYLFNSSDFVEKTIKDFYEENGKINFGEFFENKLLDVICDNVKVSMKDFHVKLKNNYDEDINSVFENTIEALEINKILTLLEERISQKKIVDFIGDNASLRLSSNLILKIKEFTETDDGKKLIDDFSGELYNLLKNIDKPIFEIFSDNLKSNAESFLKDKLQYAVKEMILWIEKNKEDIDLLIEGAIDDTISSIDDGMKKNILDLVKDKFLNDVSKKFDIVAKITEYLEQNTDIDYISKDITLSIVNYLKEEKISDIIYKLEKNEIFTVESLKSAINYSISSYISYIPEDYFCSFLDRKIEDIFNIDLVSVFKNYIKEPIIYSLKHSYIYTEKFTEIFIEIVTRNIKNISDLDLNDIISEKDLSSNCDTIKKFIVEKLQDNKINFKDVVSAEVKKSLDSFNLYNGLNSEIRDVLLDKYIAQISNKASSLLKSSEELEVKKLCDIINGVDKVGDGITNFILSTIKKNLHGILQGNIKKAVSSNLRTLKDEELQTMVEGFMGKEMKPITVLGAFLGAIAGIGMYFFDNSVIQYNYLTAAFISVLVYAFVGWLTNVQALEMLFKPYYEKRVFGIKIPFTPGVIVSRKPKFAKSMSAFVDEELLKKNSLEALFSKSVDSICNSMKNTIAKDDYKIISDFLKKHLEMIENKSFSYLEKLAYRNKDIMSKSLYEKAEHLNLKDINFSKIKKRSEEEILLKIKSSNRSIYDVLNSGLKCNNEFSRVMPDSFKILLKDSMNDRVQKEIRNVITFIGEKDRRTEFLLRFSNKYEAVMDNSVREIVNYEDALKWQKVMSNIMEGKITSEKTRSNILKFIENKIVKETSDNKKLGEVFGGFFTKIIENNFDNILNRVVKAILREMTNNQQAISEVAISTTKESLNFFELMGYNMLGGDDVVASIVDKLINDKFPAFIEKKRGEFKQVVEEFINNKIFDSTVENLNLTFQYEEIWNIIDQFINDKENLEKLNSRVTKVSNSLFDWLTDIKLREYLSILSIDQFEGLLSILEDEMNFTLEKLKISTVKNEEVLVKDYTKFIFKVFEEKILSNKISMFTEGINEEDINGLSDKLNKLIYNSKSIKNGTTRLVQCLEDELKQKELRDLLDLYEFEEAIKSILGKVLEDKEINENFGNIICGMINDIADSNLSFIDSSTKEAVSNLVITSILDSASRNFSNVISIIDFRKITEAQINSMDPKEIEELFNSFAKKYFSKLKLYGVGGAVFGIHWIIGVITVILYVGHEIRDNIDK
ncbi:DUF445 family protein [Clostridium thailandense]|uniref:DUF445 family protein n=1 Tax=Clostridium thailandense TaxID=2794346 RepID=UPI0039895E75